MKLKYYIFRNFCNFWPPFFFSGIKVTKLSKDLRHISVKLKLRFWNANYVGTQYGGAIFSMTDAFYMVMLIHNLGPNYIVWDKAAKIRYLKPGRTDLSAEYFLDEEDLAFIRNVVDNQGRIEWIKTVQIRDANNDVVAEVERSISIKLSSK